MREQTVAHRSGARQSTPSISIDSCSELSATVSPGSTSGGHRKTPCSSRLAKRHRPVPSQYTILIRLALRPRNTNRWPENGSCRNTACTNMASPSTPFLTADAPPGRYPVAPRPLGNRRAGLRALLDVGGFARVPKAPPLAIMGGRNDELRLGGAVSHMTKGVPWIVTKGVP